jgi:hypothetical protein
MIKRWAWDMKRNPKSEYRNAQIEEFRDLGIQEFRD